MTLVLNVRVGGTAVPDGRVRKPGQTLLECKTQFLCHSVFQPLGEPAALQICF